MPEPLVDAAQASKPVATPLPCKALEVVFHRDYKMDDGRYNNNGWLQELPDPITKMTWDNAFLISRKTAKDLNVVHTAWNKRSNGRTGFLKLN